MNSSLRISRDDLIAYSNNWGWFFAWGILLLSLGIAAISATTFTTLLSIEFLGYILMFTGAVVMVDTLTFWWQKWRGFILHFLISILYIAIAILLIKRPILVTMSITLLLGIFYIILGLSRVISSNAIKGPRWGWNFFNGLISLLLGILIIANWPASSLFIIGLFVGIDLIFFGWAYIMAALCARSFANGFIK